MADILGITEKVAYKYAIDLGIAFQLTNIAKTSWKMQKLMNLFSSGLD